MKSNFPILELRVAITAKDFARLTQFYCDQLGLNPSQQWNNGKGQALVFDMGKATLEVFDEGQAEYVDEIETGKRVSGPIRFAFQVPDVKAACKRLSDNGIQALNPPTVTPWGDLNARIEDPEGMQITLFQNSPNGS